MSSCWRGCFAGFRGGGKLPPATATDQIAHVRSAGARQASAVFEGIAEQYSVGDNVQVYSHSAQAWCSGVVEYVDDQVATVAFQPPGASSGEYGRKNVPPGHPDMRHARKPTQWTEEEKALYARLWEAAGPSHEHPRFFVQSGLSRAALKEIWSVANPAYKSQLSQDDFWLCCRMIGHCQANLDSVEMRATLENGGEELHTLLEEECMEEPPDILPEFAGAGRVDSPASMPLSDASRISSNAGQRSMFSQEEQLVYSNYMINAGPPDQHAVFLERSGLPRRALKQIWSIANPEGRPWLGIQEFSLCCRLVGHCQGLRGVPGMADVLESGGQDLHAVLQEGDCICWPPKQMPHFQATTNIPAIVHPGQAYGAFPGQPSGQGIRVDQSSNGAASCPAPPVFPPQVISSYHPPHTFPHQVVSQPVSASYQPAFRELTPVVGFAPRELTPVPLLVPAPAAVGGGLTASSRSMPVHQMGGYGNTFDIARGNPVITRLSRPHLPFPEPAGAQAMSFGPNASLTPSSASPVSPMFITQQGQA